jgi:hypothetical protein
MVDILLLMFGAQSGERSMRQLGRPIEASGGEPVFGNPELDC